jgi:stage II sporulation protein D
MRGPVPSPRHALVLVALLGGLLAPGSAHAAEPGWLVDRVRFASDGGLLDVGEVGTFRGAVDVSAAGGALSAVNDLPLEDYVKGVSEVPASWPAEAQKAQAIAARTYALHVLLLRRQRGDAPTDICSSQQCQVYTGAAAERRPNGRNWVRAVEATAGQVLLDGDEPIFAEYSSTNGGRTVPGRYPYLWSVDDPDDAASPYHEWRLGFPLADIEGLFHAEGPVIGAARSGDVVVLTTELPDHTQRPIEMSAAFFREEMNRAIPRPAGVPLTVPSMRFEVSFQPGQLIVTGRGWGHGIGMSQYGALGKARRGMAAPDILAAYYGGIRPTTVPSGHFPERIRAGVGEGTAELTVSASAPFRVIDQDGRPLVASGTGRWVLRPEGDRVRVIPPEAYGRPLNRVELTPAAEGRSPVLRLALAAPAKVRVRVAGPDGAATVVDKLLRQGSHSLALEELDTPGDWEVVVEAVSGVDRGAVVPLRYRAASLPEPAPRPLDKVVAASVTPLPPQPARGPAAVLAGILAVLITACALAHWRRMSTPR